MPFNSLCRYLQRSQAAFNSSRIAYYRLSDAVKCLIDAEEGLYGQAALVKFSLMPELETVLGLLLSRLLREPMTAESAADLCTIMREFSLLVKLITVHSNFCLSESFRRRVSAACNRASSAATLFRHLNGFAIDRHPANARLQLDQDKYDVLLGYFLRSFVKHASEIAPEHTHLLLSAIKALAAESSDPSGLTLSCNMAATIVYSRQNRWPEAYECLKAWILNPLQMPEDPSSKSLYYTLLSLLSVSHYNSKRSMAAAIAAECKDTDFSFALEPLLNLSG